MGEFQFDGSFNNEVTQVRFIKKYVKGANHSIYYQGVVGMNPPEIKGFWGFNAGGQDGKFQLTHQ